MICSYLFHQYCMVEEVITGYKAKKVVMVVAERIGAFACKAIGDGFAPSIWPLEIGGWREIVTGLV